MNPKLTAKLLLEAADDIEKLELPRNAEFNMRHYGVHPLSKEEPKLENLCGTSACLAGWLSLMPKWRRRGFKSRWNKSVTTNRWILLPKETEEWDVMGSSVFGATAIEMYLIFNAIFADREDAVASLRTLASKYKEKGEAK